MSLTLKPPLLASQAARCNPLTNQPMQCQPWVDAEVFTLVKGLPTMFRATLFVPSTVSRSHDAVQTRYFGTRRAVDLWAATVLAPITATHYTASRDLERAPSIRLESGRGVCLRMRRAWRTGDVVRTTWLQPPVTIVPSVGELGYW